MVTGARFRAPARTQQCNDGDMTTEEAPVFNPLDPLFRADP
jgi:hypothetical protein